eukprot:CAMPEP_0115034560 /NCGR_PEP_ID=MMETSP0216-20121206/40736_1 /TAXON_ID=223996 /ORGANISM="Protocruzia adherens, Strain Boccale" /LENGTH=372 /DNA_ID=CAMNT_0002413493 /DNA_START=249 /DNA_END=1364 /DNA_ORIENTATION=-
MTSIVPTTSKKVYTRSEVATHNTPEDAWVVIEGKIYNVTKFAKVHPGGTKILTDYAGQDATKDFNYFHTRRVLQKYGPKLLVGELQEGLEKKVRREERAIAAEHSGASYSATETFGENVPYGDPNWYQGWRSPYYNDSHKKYRAAIREYLEAELAPNVSRWVEDCKIPLDVMRGLAKQGIYQSLIKGKWNSQYYGTTIPGGIKPEEFDWFHTMIAASEFGRLASSGMFWGVFCGVNIGLPPLNFGSDYLKKLVVSDIANARKFICLAITEPWAGSDVANIRTTAKLSEDGKYYIVNGLKKWITNGVWADFFTTAVRTGGDGMGGISLLLLEKSMPGVNVRKITTTGSDGSGTSYIAFENVKVPVENRIGKEG